VTSLDWVIVAFTVLLAFAGARQGFVVGALSLAGFAVGAVIGTRLGPVVLPDGARSPYAPLFGLMGALLGGALLASGFGGVAQRMRGAIRLTGFGAVDAALGAVLSAAVALGIAWIAGAAAVQIPGQHELRRQVRRSAILQHLNETLPPSGAILNALNRFDPLPAIRGPSADVPAPRAAVARDPDVRAATRSVVKITGTACGLGVEGSGWVAGDGLVVTNAHVVAGEDDTTVQVGGTGPKLHAVAVAFDPHNDVAVLRVDGLGAAPLPIRADPPSGASAAIVGFPENGPLDIRAGRIGETRTVSTQDAYGRGPVRRRIVPLRGLVRSGNSGGPMIDRQGRVVTTVFAATVGGGQSGGYGIPGDVVRRDIADATATVSTGPCAR
jgi:S1-C subfamily serine protease